MRTTCEQCQTRFRGEGHRTSTRVLCTTCYNTLMGLSAGFVASNGSVGDAISTAGWLSRVKKARK